VTTIRDGLVGTACCLELVVSYRLGGTGIAFEHLDISFPLKMTQVFKHGLIMLRMCVHGFRRLKVDY
jgi:hypothetical protein